MANHKREVGLLVQPRVSKRGVPTLASNHRMLHGCVGVVIASSCEHRGDHGVLVLWGGTAGIHKVSLGEYEVICDID